MDYETLIFAHGYFIFGPDGGGTAYAFDKANGGITFFSTWEKAMIKSIIQTKASLVELLDEFGISKEKIGGNVNIHQIFQ
jgi:hypothetical protein